MPICTHLRITHYVGDWPDQTHPTILLDAGDWLDDRRPLSGGIQQLIQTADYIRSTAPAFIPRGNLRAPLQWTTLRRIPDPADALATALALSAALPVQPGWLSIHIPASGRTWIYLPAVVGALAWDHDLLAGHLRLTWTVHTGPLYEITLSADPTALTGELGAPLHTEDDHPIHID